MHNLRVDQLRRPGLPMRAIEEEDFEVSARPTQTDELELRDVDSALRLLPDEQREVLLLVALEDMSYESIAATLGIPLGTVMSRLSRGRERLRSIMDGKTPVTRLRVVR
jgi:RNA polymerase sigma-70 factor (ECF subfamily)